MERVCRLTEITPATIEGVSTFYTQFRHRPVGKHIISVCHGTACHVKGSELVQDALERHLGIAPRRRYRPQGPVHGREGRLPRLLHAGPGDPDRRRDLRQPQLAPCRRSDRGTFSRTTARAGRPVWRRPSHDGPVGEIRVGLGSCCVAQGSGQGPRDHLPHLGRQRAPRRWSSRSAAWGCAIRRRWWN